MIIAKKNYKIILLYIYLSELFVWIKSSNFYYHGIYIVELFIMLLLIKSFMMREYVYFTLGEDKNRLFVEKPIIGKEKLSRVQNKALEELMQVIDSRKSTESINIGLIGAWGSGKTSITDTMIYLYQKNKRKRRQIFYFET